MLRSALVLVAAAAVVVILGPVGLLLAWLTRSARPLFALAEPAVRMLLALAGVRLEIVGRERLAPDTAYVFVANHVSNLDPPIAYIAIGRDVRALAKAELFRIPVFGSVLRRAGFPAVDRSDRSRAIAALQTAAAELTAGHDFLAFPEGTRSPTGALGAFKKGPFVMAIEGQAPVAPLLIRGTRELLPRGSLLARPGRVRVEFLEPVPTRGLQVGDRDDLRTRTHEAMAARLGANGPGIAKA